MRGKRLLLNNMLLGLMLFVLVQGLFGGCIKQPEILIPPDECYLPPDVFLKYETDLEIAGLHIGDFALGKFNVYHKPEVINVLSELSRDHLIVNYLVCVAKKRGEIETREQAAHLRNKLLFMHSKPPPTPQQIMDYDKEHPFPRKQGKLDITGVHQVNGDNYLTFAGAKVDQEVGVINSGDGDLIWWLDGFPYPFFFSEADNKKTKQLKPKKSDTFHVVRTNFPVDAGKVYSFDIKSDTNEVASVGIKVEDVGSEPYAKLNRQFNSSLQDIYDGKPRYGITRKHLLGSKTDSLFYELAQAVVEEQFPDQDWGIRQIITAQVLTEGERYGAALIAYKRVSGVNWAAIQENASYAHMVNEIAYLAKAKGPDSEEQSIYFAFDKSAVAAEAEVTLGDFAQRLLSNPNVQIVVEGYADKRGTYEYNLALGDRRAESVKNYLINKGVDQDRISTVSYGEERPLCIDSNENCWGMNRRAIISVYQD